MFGYIIGLISIILLGGSIEYYLFRKSTYILTKIEFIVYAFLIGYIVISIILFLLGRIGINYSVYLMWLLVTLIFMFTYFTYLFYKHNTLQFYRVDFKNRFSGKSILVRSGIVIGFIWILFKLLFGFLSVSSVPTYQDDAFGNWNYRTKVFFTQESLVLDKQSPDFLGQGYQQYPLGPYLSRVFTQKLANYWSEGMINIHSFYFYIISIILVGILLYRMTNNFSLGLLGSLILTGIPLYFVHGTNPYFDGMLSVYILFASYITFLFIQNKINWLARGLVLGLLGFVKSEGLLIYTVGIFISSIIYLLGNNYRRKINLISIIKGSILVFLINLPFIIFKLVYGLGFGNGDASVGSTTLGFHPEIFKAAYYALFHGGSYNVLFYIFVTVLLFGIYHKKKDFFLSFWFITFFIFLGFITFIYLTTFTYTYVLDQTGVNRTMMQLMPNLVVLVLVGIYLLYDKNEKI